MMIMLSGACSYLWIVMQGGQEVKHENTRTRETENLRAKHSSNLSSKTGRPSREKRRQMKIWIMRRSEVKWNIAFFLTKRQGAFCEGVSLRTVCDKQNKEGKKLVTAEPPKLLASPIYMQSHNHNNYDGFHLKMFQSWSKKSLKSNTIIACLALNTIDCFW